MSLPAGVEASIGGVRVTLINVSTIGALLEHQDRFTILGARIHLQWQGREAELPAKVVRTAIMGRREGRVVYHTGIQFGPSDPASESLIEAIVHSAEPHVQPAAEPQFSGDDTWTRRIRTPLAADEGEDTWVRRIKTRATNDDNGSPYIRFHLTPSGWTKEFVTSPAQPHDGFTVARDAADSAALQRAFENADDETRYRLQCAIAAKLG